MLLCSCNIASSVDFRIKTASHPPTPGTLQTVLFIGLFNDVTKWNSFSYSVGTKQISPLKNCVLLYVTNLSISKHYILHISDQGQIYCVANEN